MTHSALTRDSGRFVPQSALDVLAHCRPALLLWDLQNGLGGHADHLELLRPKWCALRAAAIEAGILILRSRHVAPNIDLMDDTEIWRICRKQGVRSVADLSPYMQDGTEDVEFLEGFEPGPSEVVIDKSTPSLFLNTPADARLRTAGVNAIVLAGVATDIGIEFTARHALALGYFPIVATDAVGAYSSAAQERGLGCLASFALLEETDSIIAKWKRT